MSSTKPTCPDCGSAPTNHFMERLGDYFDVYLNPLLAPMEHIGKIVKLSALPFHRLTRPFVRVLCKARLACVRNEPSEQVGFRARCLWDETKKRGIKMSEFRLFNRFNDSYIAEFQNQFLLFQGLPKLPDKEIVSIRWMDDKSEMNKRFARLGIPVPKSGVAASKKEALRWYNRLSKPMIVKPNTGSRSRHTTIHVETPEALVTAFHKAQMLCHWVVVQEELKGSVYRGTVIGGKVIGVLRRDPAAVIGDGAHTVAELARLENEKPLRQGPLFHHVPECGDAVAEKELARQNFTWNSVPPPDAIVALGTKTSRGVGGGLADVTDVTHPDIIATLEQISRVLDCIYVGVDFIVSDIKKSWKNQDKCGVIECNSLPFIDLHHYPSIGQPRNTAGALWDVIFPESKPALQPSTLPAGLQTPRAAL